MSMRDIGVIGYIVLGFYGFFLLNNYISRSLVIVLLIVNKYWSKIIVYMLTFLEWLGVF